MMSFLRYVGKFIPRKEKLGHHTRFTNVLVKNFGEDFTEDQLRETFSAFGVIVSAVVMKDNKGKGRGCGFVSYEDHKAASKVSSPRRPFLTYCVVYINVCVLCYMQAVKVMNGKMVNGRAIYVNRAQKKKERQMELQRKYEAEKMERYNR